ncbi:hypothetical protein OAE83_00935 [bacterium]|nr:hypothetical protein [bacterium]
MLIKNEQGDYVIKKRSQAFEALAVTPLAAPDLNGDMAFTGIEGASELATGGFLTYSIYTATLAALDTVEARRKGLITAQEQRQYILSKTWEATKGAVPQVLILAAVLTICPWLMGVATVGAFVGSAFMATKLVRAAIGAMSDEQVTTIKQKAADVGVSVPGLSDDEPLPNLS